MAQTSINNPQLFFFVGAGASVPLGFPDGKLLKKDIQNALVEPCTTPLRCVLKGAFTEPVLKRLAERLQGASPEDSIDAILERHRSDSELLLAAKVAIRHIILECEGRVSERQLDDYWLTKFFDRYLAHCRQPVDLYFPGRDSFLNNLSVYTLNYDRVFEHVLVRWCERRFGDRAFEAINYPKEDLPVIFHAHGSVGRCFGDESAVPFGSIPPTNPAAARQHAEHLRLWFEVSNWSGDWGIKSRLFELRPILLLAGFGYHPQILNRFASQVADDRQLARVIGTAYGVDEPQRKAIRRQLGGRLALPEAQIDLLDDNADCAAAVDHLFALRQPGPRRLDGSGRRGASAI